MKVEEATGASGKKTEAEGGSGAAGGPMPSKSGSIDTLMGEASALLKSLRSVKVKAIKLKFMDVGGNLDMGTALGLLDGGATHPLRQALPGELGSCGVGTWLNHAAPRPGDGYIVVGRRGGAHRAGQRVD